MAKKGSKKAAADAPAEREAEVRTVKYVVNRPYSAGEPFDIVDAQVAHEYEDEEDLLRLRLINPPRGVEEDVKRVRLGDAGAPGTWFDPGAPAEEVTE
jgi:hypothetical protein